MTKIKDLPKHKRPREKLSEKGAENLSDIELLAILIRTGRAGRSALDIARDTFKKYPLTKLLSVSKDDLVSVKGLEETKAITIKAALELGKRAVGSFNDSRPILDSPKEIAAQLSDLRGKKKECFMALYLNARNQLILKETISVGTLTASLVHPREVFEPAVRHFASSVIVAHNHPSDNPEASEEDIKLTGKKIIVAARDISTQFISLIKPMFEKIQILRIQNQKLAQARDLLLPRLMSGAIEV